MKKNLMVLSLLIFLALATFMVVRARKQAPSPAGKETVAAEGTDEDPSARMNYLWMLSRDPLTNSLPKNVGTLQNNYVNRLALQNRELRVTPQVKAWTHRGPYNVGGRTKALAIDIRDGNVILAGCVSSGMFKSIDGGKSWKQTTTPSQLHSVTCIAQNRAPGRENTWYYGTGEYGGYGAGRGGSAAGPLSSVNSNYRGDGIFKSVDNGSTWTQLPSTVSGTPEISDSFDFIYKLITFGEDGVLAATSCGVFKSTDGGTTWKHVIDFGEIYTSSDIAVTSQGTFYAAIDGPGTANGLYQSDDGENWNDISPAAFPDSTMRSVIAIPPSNEKIVYLLTDVAHWKQIMKKHDPVAGWTDMTANLPNHAEMTTYGGNMLMLYVKPDDENVLFLGTVGLMRSRDGGHSFEVIGGNVDFHVDQQAIAFVPNNPKAMIVGNDGGLFRTDDNVADTRRDPNTGEYHIEWKSLNNGYVTTQFYTVAIDHGTPGSELVMGGTQDNAMPFTSSIDPTALWDGLFRGAADGGFCYIADGGKECYFGFGATFQFWRYKFSDPVDQVTEITPASAIGMGLWMNPALVDPHDNRILYVPSRQQLWRNSDISAIPYVFPPAATNQNWEKLVNVNPTWNISALGMSAAEPRRLYFGGVVGPIYRVENPQIGQPDAIELPGNGIAYYTNRYLSCIDVDPRNPDKLLIVFPEYNTISIYRSEDGGYNWTPVSGNLEEKPNGYGSGPSVRWVATLYVQDTPVYFAGTSAGLFSTIRLDGPNTIWVQEGAETIGNVVIDMVDVRQSDGYVAVASHGNGIYTAYLKEIATSVAERKEHPNRFALKSAYPNPFNASTTISYSLPEAGRVRIEVFNVLGQKIATLVDGERPAGEQTVRWQADRAASGEYLVRLEFAGRVETQKVLLQK